MNPEAMIEFALLMNSKARRADGAAKRISYTQAEREKAIAFLSEIERRGGTLHTAAGMLGMRTNTLTQWLVKATAPGSEWRVLDNAAAIGNLLHCTARALAEETGGYHEEHEEEDQAILGMAGFPLRTVSE